MSKKNFEALRAAFELYAHGDFSPIGLLGDDFVLVISPEAPDAGTYRGEEARRWLRSWVASFEGMTIAATEVLDLGDKVFLGMTQRGPYSWNRPLARGSLVAGVDFSRGRNRQGRDVS
jgi:ketosteroid isomerase-like protein